MAKNPVITKTKILVAEDGTRTYEKTCPRCRKLFVTSSPQQVYCSDACKEAYNKARKRKSKSGKRYVRKHDVSRANEAASRALGRKLMMLVYKPMDMMTGEKFDSWDFIQCHHANLNMFDNRLDNLIPLTPQSHDSLHKQLKEKFGKDVEDKLYKFGQSPFNFESEDKYQEYLSLVKEVVEFERSLFKYDFGQPLPKFDSGDNE